MKMGSGRVRRLASRLLGQTVRGAVRASGRAPRGIFTYHSVGEAAGSVPVEVLEDQIAAIRRAGFEIVPLSAMVEWLAGRGDLPGRAMALTFDDGLADTARVAAPVLRRHSAPATVFPVLGFLGGPRRWASSRARGMLLQDDGHPETRPWDYMTWNELDGWIEAGGEVGGHTLSHPFLSDLSDADGAAEVGGCRRELARRYGRSPEVFCYPFGDAGGSATRWVREAGFSAAVTSVEGNVERGQDPLRLQRLPAPDVAGPDFEDLLYGIFRWRQALRTAGGRP